MSVSARVDQSHRNPMLPTVLLEERLARQRGADGRQSATLHRYTLSPLKGRSIWSRPCEANQPLRNRPL